MLGRCRISANLIRRGQAWLAPFRRAFRGSTSEYPQTVRLLLSGVANVSLGRVIDLRPNTERFAARSVGYHEVVRMRAFPVNPRSHLPVTLPGLPSLEGASGSTAGGNKGLNDQGDIHEDAKEVATAKVVCGHHT